jgi:hypothetical protein
MTEINPNLSTEDPAIIQTCDSADEYIRNARKGIARQKWTVILFLLALSGLEGVNITLWIQSFLQSDIMMMTLRMIPLLLVLVAMMLWIHNYRMQFRLEESLNELQARTNELRRA